MPHIIRRYTWSSIIEYSKTTIYLTSPLLLDICFQFFTIIKTITTIFVAIFAYIHSYFLRKKILT